MRNLIRRLFSVLVIVVVGSFTFAGTSQATSTVNTGFNLFETTPGSAFFFAPIPIPQFVDFEGAPLPCFDFGDGNGCVNTNATDTIIERLQLADLSSGNDTIDIELVALSLVSSSPVDLGFGAGFEFINITLNTSSPSIQSNMTIFDTGEGSPHGDFDSILNFSFDVVGDVGGFYGTFEKTITAIDQDWRHNPPGGLRIDGINNLLNTVDQTTDFWPVGIVIHDDGSGTAIHTARATVPEPSTAVLLGIGLGLAARRRRNR